MGDNYYSYGIKPDRKSLEALFRYSHQQGLCGRELTIEEFVEPASMVLLTPRREKQMNRTAQKDPWALPEIMGRENLSAKGTGQIGSPTAQKKTMATEYHPCHMGWFSCENVKIGRVPISPNRISIYYINSEARL